MSNVEVYTIANGLRVGSRELSTANGAASWRYTFQLCRDDKVSSSNDLWVILFHTGNTGTKSNTDGKLWPSTWHLSIGKDGNPLDPWTLWKQARFEVSKVEVITGEKEAKPWLLSFRRRDATVIREEQAAIDNYNERVQLARRMMQQSIPGPLPMSAAQNASSVKGSRDASGPETSRSSNAASLASKFLQSSLSKTNKTSGALVKVCSIASTATGGTGIRNPEKKGWRRGFLKMKK